MKLQNIEKTVYRKRLNIAIVTSIIALTLLSVIFGAILIELFGNALPAVDPQTGEVASNFRFNFVGVIFAFLVCAYIIQKLKTTEFFYEMYHVWLLKQIQNVIYRRLKKIKHVIATERDPIDTNAFLVMKYYYASLRHVYLLDDNTLTLSELSKKSDDLEELMESLNVNVSIDDFDRKMLIRYR